MKFIKKNYKYILFVIGIFVLNVFLISIRSDISWNHRIILCGINLLVFLVFSFIFYKKEKMKIEKVFLIMFIPISITFCALMPVNQVPDEFSHFMRAYEISEGNLVTTNHKWDASICDTIGNNKYTDILKHIKIKTSSKKALYYYDNTSLYSFVCYIPQALGVRLAKIVGFNILGQAYLGRLFNLAVFIAIMFFAIKLIPYKKECILIITFLPIVIQEAISLSPDALTIATAVLFVSSILYFKNNKDEKFTKMQFMYLAILSVILSLCKIVYLPICLLLFLLPKEKFSSLKKKNILIIALAIFVVAINLIWLNITSQFLPYRDDVNSSEQLKFIFNHIPQYIILVFRTYDRITLDLIFNSLGRGLGWYNMFLSYLYMIPLTFIFVVMYLTNNYEKINLKKYEKLLILFITLSVIFLISTSLYLQWTPIGSDEIFGIQGRYFIPLFPVLAFLSTKMKVTPKINWSNKYLYMFLLGLDYYALTVILFKFM